MRSLNKIRRPLRKSCIQLIFICLFVSCLTPTEVPTEKIGGRLVVSGQISPIQDQNIIQLGLSAATERLPFPLSGAFITLFDDAGESYVYLEDYESLGTYTLPDISGIPGRTYYIQITTPSGEVYESTPEKMPEVVGQLETKFEVMREEYSDLEGIISTQQFVKIYSDVTIPSWPEPIYLKWNVTEVFLVTPTDIPDPFGHIPLNCYIAQNADPQRIVLFNGADVKASVINQLLVGSRILDYSFLEKHYLTTYQSSLTNEAHEYWRKVNVLANQVGSIFDTPPAEITGNIFNVNNHSEKVLGYFQATNQTFDRFFLVPFDLPTLPVLKTCTYDPQVFEYPARCADCISVRNSSYQRPIWF